MATRTSSPPRKRPSGSQAKKKRPASRGSSTARRKPASRKPARTGPGPVAVVVGGIGRGLVAIWLAIAGMMGALARGIGSSAS